MNLPTCFEFTNLLTFVFKSFKLVRALVSLFIPSLSLSDFKAIKCFLAAKSNASMPVVCSNFLINLTSPITL